MALVEYSSSSASSTPSDPADGDSGPPPAKRRKDAASPPSLETGSGSNPSATADGGHPAASVPKSDMPPLPSAFHDLYASTVRQSVSDDPLLHHGRKRQTPHVAGNWPTHLYVEWRPDEAQHAMLTQLIAEVGKGMDGDITLHSFLDSDLGASLPLHISLSRPITLTTKVKDDFLERIAGSLKGTGLGPFTVSPKGLAWYRSPDSERAFLILRVISTSTPNDQVAPNPELMALLNRCNTVVTSFQQPALYQRTQKEPVGTAFHISIAWTFDLPADDEVSLKALYLFRQKKYAVMREWEVEVAGVKAKIGNVVNHIPLTVGSGYHDHREGSEWLFAR